MGFFENPRLTRAMQLIEPYEPLIYTWRGRKFPLPDEVIDELEKLKIGNFMFLYQNAFGPVRFIKESQVTDYGEFSRDDRYPDNDPPPRNNATPTNSKGCSKSDNLGMFLAHLISLRHVLKNAAKDDFCLDELVKALPAFERALEYDKTGE